VMRIVGQWVQRARSIAREFQGSLDQMMREAELDDIKRHLDKATSFDVEHEIRQAVDPGGELQRSLNEPVLANPLADAPKPATEASPALPPSTPSDGTSGTSQVAFPAPREAAEPPKAEPETRGS
jgi:sec-independent protein translocase protein TatB